MITTGSPTRTVSESAMGATSAPFGTRSSWSSARRSRRAGALEGSHGIGDVLAETRDGATVSRGERVVALVRRRLAHRRAAGPRGAVPGAAHGPHGIKGRRVARRRVEALHLDGY